MNNIILSKNERNCNSMDKIITLYFDQNQNIEQTNLLQFALFLYKEKKYSRNYIENILHRTFTILNIDKNWMDTVLRYLSDRIQEKTSEKSLKSDGILVFNNNEIKLMREKAYGQIDSLFNNNNNISVQRIAFLFIFFLLDITGKRLSEILLLDRTNLKNLQQYGLTVIDLPKTRKLGRIEMISNDTDYILNSERLNVFIRYQDDDKLELPMIQINLDKTKILSGNLGRKTIANIRRVLDKEFDTFYQEIFHDKIKPRGLSFHAFRRIYAGERYLDKRNIMELSQYMDHTNYTQTNRYVNRYLRNMLN